MNSRTQRDFFKKVAKMDREEREARLRWIEATIAKRVEAARQEWEPLEFQYVSLASLHAMLTCNRNLIPVQFWRPDDIRESQSPVPRQRY